MGDRLAAKVALITGAASGMVPRTPGRLDILVNNAGVVGHADAVAETEQGWARILDVNAAAQNALHDCAVKVAARFHEVVIYQPASRYWTFQWYELAIFLGAALILAGACIWWVRRRLS